MTDEKEYNVVVVKIDDFFRPCEVLYDQGFDSQEEAFETVNNMEKKFDMMRTEVWDMKHEGLIYWRTIYHETQ